MTKRTLTIFNIGMIFAIVVALLWAVSAAYAAVAVPSGETGVRINWGEPAAALLTLAGGVATYLIGEAMGLLPGPVRWAMKLGQIDQVIFAGIDRWVLDNAEEIKTKGWTVDLKNKAVQEVAIVAINTGNKFIKQVTPTLTDKVKARLARYIREHAS